MFLKENSLWLPLPKTRTPSGETFALKHKNRVFHAFSDEALPKKYKNREKVSPSVLQWQAVKGDKFGKFAYYLRTIISVICILLCLLYDNDRFTTAKRPH